MASNERTIVTPGSDDSNNWVVTQGEAPVLSGIVNLNGQVVDLTGATFKAFFPGQTEGTENWVNKGTGAIVVAADGSFTVTLTAVELATIETADELTWALEVTISSEVFLYWADGGLRIRPRPAV